MQCGVARTCRSEEPVAPSAGTQSRLALAGTRSRRQLTSSDTRRAARTLYVTAASPSVRPSVRLYHRPTAAAAGLLPSAVQAGDIDRHGVSSKCGQCHVDSRRTMLDIHRLVLLAVSKLIRRLNAHKS